MVCRMELSLNIPGIAQAMSAAQFTNDLGTAVLSKSLDSMEIMGDSMVRMMENSVTPHIGGNIDFSA